MMNHSNTSRRQFLKRSAAAATLGTTVPYWWTSQSTASGGELKNDRLTTGAIGVGGRGSGIGKELAERSDMVAACDVDRDHAESFKGDDDLQIYKDYRELLDRQDIEAITIGTPDHWHTPICLDALRAGKDVYCEKPLTLTVDEGKLIRQAVEDTGQVLQVGSQQRTGYGLRFLRAVVLARAGRLGKIKKVTVSLGTGPNEGPFANSEPPANLDWDLWLGQAPEVPFSDKRCHYTFRWWYEYSGGKMTDWGAHHIDIAQWAIGMEHSGPTLVEPLMASFPDHAHENGFNTAVEFRIRCLFSNGVEMFVEHDGRGILIEGEEGTLDIRRSGLKGSPLDEIKNNAQERDWLEGEVVKLFGGRQPKQHMDNFLDAIKDRQQPMSDVFTHHRAMTTCHLCNIAIRTGRQITWDANAELAVGDDDINQNWLKREQRKGYEFG